MKLFLMAAVVGVSTYVALDAAFTECRSRALAATPKTEPLPREVKVEFVSARGIIVADFNKFMQWDNQPKQFYLAESLEPMKLTELLAYTSKATYLELERLDGNYVEVRGIRAKRDRDEWFVVLAVEVMRK